MSAMPGRVAWIGDGMEGRNPAKGNVTEVCAVCKAAFMKKSGGAGWGWRRGLRRRPKGLQPTGSGDRFRGLRPGLAKGWWHC